MGNYKGRMNAGRFPIYLRQFIRSDFIDRSAHKTPHSPVNSETDCEKTGLIANVTLIPQTRSEGSYRITVGNYMNNHSKMRVKI